MDCLFVCSYNCRTIASGASLRMLLLSSRLVKYDVIALQETEGRTETIRKTDHNELLIIGPKANGNVGGVGFLINSIIAHLVNSHIVVSPRLAVLRLRTDDRVAISVINAYAPTSAAPEEEREDFYRLLEKTIQEEKSYYKYVVGDLNAVVGTNCNGDWRLGSYGSGDRTENGELLLNLLYACRLFHGNFMFEKPSATMDLGESKWPNAYGNRSFSPIDAGVYLVYTCCPLLTMARIIALCAQKYDSTSGYSSATRTGSHTSRLSSLIQNYSNLPSKLMIGVS
uniref:Endo/exonuclease/phosphatase domain-containing protein n=1 Tax=Haemonchus placei TaxID=6290 RepID=A0A0N4W3T1_HAEPC